MRVISFSYWLVIFRKSFLLMESLRQVRLIASWMSFLSTLSSFMESSSPRVEAALALSGLRCLKVSLRERRSLVVLEKASLKVIL